MFERFTSRARSVIALAREEAVAGHGLVEPEHVLLGLLRETHGRGAQLLAPDITLKRVREELHAFPGGSGPEPSAGEIALSPSCKEVVERALRVALSLGQPRVGTEHILLALTSQQAGVAAQVLIRLGTDAETLLQALTGRARKAPQEVLDDCQQELDAAREAHRHAATQQRASAESCMAVTGLLADRARGKLLSPERRAALDVLVDYATDEWLHGQPLAADENVRRHYRHHCMINIEAQVLAALLHPQLGPEGDHIDGHPGGPNSIWPA
jgi:ATP-dependent Clp protease ATP-binding subunit ClpA